MAERKNDPADGVAHETVRLSRLLPAPPDVVFEAWRSVEARKIWSVPAPGVEIEFDTYDFREGGVELSRCGPRGDLRFRCDLRFVDIVPDQRLIMSEEVSTGGKRLSAALVTLTFSPSGAQTRMNFTAQVVALDGSDMVQGYHDGWTGAFANLEAYLTRGAAA